MQRKFLEELGLEKENVDKIMAENGTDIEKAKEPIKTLETENTSLKAQITERDTQLDTLTKNNLDNVGLQEQLTQLQEENRLQKEKYETDLNQERLLSAITANVGGDVHDVSLLISQLDLTKLSIKDGEVNGLKDQLEPIRESKSFLFKEQPTAPQLRGFQPGASGDVKPSEVQESYQAKLNDARKNSNTAEVIQVKQDAAKEGVYLI